MNRLYQHPHVRILVFCKSPEPGRVKTRLVADLGEFQSALIAQELATARIDMAISSALAPVQLWCYPDVHRPFFQRFAADVELKQQQGADLGERMLFGFTSALAETEVTATILIGTDCPTLDMDYLELAIAALDQHEVVIGPAEDGGYGLMGLRSPEVTLFEDINWSTETVFSETIHRLEVCRADWVQLPTIWDVDRPEDVARYRKFLASSDPQSEMKNKAFVLE
jgi:rSAM/selenodomain-associated transferase 1